MKNLSILVTGSTGFLGSHILESLMTDPTIHPVAFCRNPSKLLPGFKGEVREGDLRDPGAMARVLRGVDVVCHAAAWTSLWAHEKDERERFRDPAISLIDTAVASGVKRFIFDSTPIVAGPHRDGSPVGDDEPGKRQPFWPHLNMVIDIEEHMRKNAGRGTGMVVLRCGHFLGERYGKGLLSLFLPRLKTHLVPSVAGGKARVPLVYGGDLGRAVLLAVKADPLNDFESFNICGPSFPTMREVIEFLHEETGSPRPHFGVPLAGAYAFGWLMEKLNPLLPGDPFLTRAIVYLGEDWHAPSDLAKRRLGYEPKTDWKDAVRRQLKDMERRGYPRISMVDPH